MHRLTVLSMRPEDGRPRMGVPRTPCRDGPQIRPHWPGVSSGNPKSTESHLITGPEPLIRVETNCTGIAGTTCKKARSPRAEIRSIRVRTGRAAWPPPRASGAVHTALISVQPAVTDPPVGAQLRSGTRTDPDESGRRIRTYPSPLHFHLRYGRCGWRGSSLPGHSNPAPGRVGRFMGQPGSPVHGAG